MPETLRQIMKTTKSKFRLLYILKLSLGYTLAIVCICGLSIFYQDMYSSEWKRMATVLIIVIIFLTIMGSLDFLNLTRIIVRDTQLEIQSYFIKNKIVNFTEIKAIERHKIILRGDAGQISDGYHLSEIILANGSSLIISADKFENYEQIILIIRNKLNA